MYAHTTMHFHVPYMQHTASCILPKSWVIFAELALQHAAASTAKSWHVVMSMCFYTRQSLHCLQLCMQVDLALDC